MPRKQWACDLSTWASIFSFLLLSVPTLRSWQPGNQDSKLNCRARSEQYHTERKNTDDAHLKNRTFTPNLCTLHRIDTCLPNSEKSTLLSACLIYEWISALGLN